MARRTCLSGLVICLFLALFSPAVRGLTLIEESRPKASICLGKDAPEKVREAARELADVLATMAGPRLEVRVVEEPPAGPAILLGRPAEQAGLKMAKRSRAGDGFRYRVQDGRLLIVGESPQGVYHGVFDLLERFGCGWYVPGEIGEVIPKKRTVRVADDLDHTGVSDSINRRFWYGGKNGHGAATAKWLGRNKGFLRRGSWVHAWHGLVPPKKYFEEHPEYFGLKRGKRSTHQLCTTNPETIRIAAETLMKRMEDTDLAVLPAGPNDGGGLCECLECAKLDTAGYVEPSSNKPACSTRIFKFASDLAEITSKRFPDKDLGVLVYSEYSRVPLKLKKLHPNVFPMSAPIRRCRLHGPGNPVCPWNKLWAEEIREWSKLSDKMGFYIYNYNLADSLVPLSKISFYERLVGEVHQLDIRQLAWVFETIDSWSQHAPHLYLSARIGWNSHIDVDAEMDRFFSGFYGRAAGPMRRYWLRIDEAYRTTPVHTGSQYGLHHVWKPALLEACRKDIEEAKRMAATDRERKAVAMAEAGLRCAELFTRIRNATIAFEFLKADKLQQELKSHIDTMAENKEPNWVHQRYAWGYYRRFTGLTVAGGAEVLKKGGRIVVKFPDVWKFKKDEHGEGVQDGWYKPEFDAGGWKDFGTWSKSWDDQGLGWYHGDGWYRVSFTLPPEQRGRPGELRLWFGGFDYNVDVYLNGHHLGEKKGFAQPREYDKIGPNLRFGGENVLAIRVSAGGLAELGTGGLMAPVMIYRTKAAAGEGGAEEKGVDYKM